MDDKLITGYHFDQMFRCFVKEHTNEYPKQTIEIITAIDKGQTKGSGGLQFTEEIKDGRSPKFDTNSPLKLKDKSYSLDHIELTIVDVIPTPSNNQPSSFNEYRDYNYTIVFLIKYKSWFNQHEDVAHKAFMNKHI